MKNGKKNEIPLVKTSNTLKISFMTFESNKKIKLREDENIATVKLAVIYRILAHVNCWTILTT